MDLINEYFYACLVLEVDRYNRFEDGSFLHEHRQCPTMQVVGEHTVSVQASPTHYCSPKVIEPPYTSVEIGFPSFESPHFDVGEDGVAQVPVENLERAVKEQGGIAYRRQLKAFDISLQRLKTEAKGFRSPIINRIISAHANS